MGTVTYDKEIATLKEFRRGLAAEIERRENDVTRAVKRKRLADAEALRASDALAAAREERDASVRMLEQSTELLAHYETRHGRTSLEINMLDLADRARHSASLPETV